MRYSIMNSEEAQETINNRILKLKTIAAKENPTNVQLQSAHERKEEAAIAYIRELNELSAVVSDLRNIVFVAQNTMKKEEKKADFASVEYDGFFSRLCIVESFDKPPVSLIWLKPFSEL